jgi:hypothetical protein
MTNGPRRFSSYLIGALALCGLCAAAAFLPGVPVSAQQIIGAPPGLNLSEPGVGWAGFVPPKQPSREAFWLFNNYGSPARGIGPVTDDPEHPYFNNVMASQLHHQPTYRVADLNNAAGRNLMPWVREALAKQNALVLQGRNGEPREPRCWETGTPAFHLNPGVMNFIQTPKEVVLFLVGRMRHIWLNVPHSANPKPSWYGESVGHYEGDTLVVDTIGLNAKTFVDNFRTPHSEKLHVVERWRMINERQAMEVTFTVEDPEAFYEPWSGTRRFRRVSRQFEEEICAENNQQLFDYHIPVASKADF